MAVTTRNYLVGTTNNYFQPTITPDLFVLRSPPTTSSIKFTLNVPGGDIWLEIAGQFPQSTLSSIKNITDVVALNLQMAGTKLYLGQRLLSTTTFDPPLNAAQSSATFSASGYANEFAGNDIFIGSDDLNNLENDEMYGYGGNDTFYPNFNPPNTLDLVNGGDGIDTVVYKGKQNEYARARATNLSDPASGTNTVAGFRITDSIANRDGTDTLISVERLTFTDGMVALDTSGVGGQAYRIYKAAFNRIPDSVGLGYWIKQMDSGMGMVEVAARFIDSPEFRTLYGQNPTNADFLLKVYSNVLGRTPDEGGYAWWLNQVNTNPEKTRQKVLADFSESQENKDSVATLIGNGIPFTEFMS